jgi:hypothetical protein
MLPQRLAPARLLPALTALQQEPGHDQQQPVVLRVADPRRAVSVMSTAAAGGALQLTGAASGATSVAAADGTVGTGTGALGLVVAAGGRCQVSGGRKKAFYR